MVQTWQKALRRAARQAGDEGHLPAGTDPEQLAFEMYGLVLALHHDARFLRSAGAVDRARTAFERLIQHYTLGAPASPGQAAPLGAAAH